MASAPITHYLPEDLMVDILARLPVKSLKRFNCVCKSWSSLIQSPQFISTHCSFSQCKTIPLIKHDNLVEGKSMVSFISNRTLAIVDSYEVPYFADTVRSRGCCNGIVCLWDGFDGFLLWNIATKEFKILPICPVEYPPDRIGNTWAAGLGYDSKRDDYKVIRIDSFYNYGYSHGNQVSLYNLSTDSWKKLNNNLTAEFIVFSTNQVYCNGFYHIWAAIDDEELLLSFDMSDEVFVITQFPDGGLGKQRNTPYMSFFFEINGSVGGMVCHKYVEEKCSEVWVLGKLGVRDSWMKLFTVEPNFLALPLGVLGNEVLFDCYFEGRSILALYPSNQVTKMLEFEEIIYDRPELIMYAESLVSLRGGRAFNH